jgi:prevent-host-death family protein
MRQVSLAEAKAKLSDLIADTRAGKPTIIARRGKLTAVVLSFEEYERLSRVPSLGRLLAYPGEADDLPDRARS